MFHRIARFAVALSRGLLPGTGRHRACGAPPARAGRYVPAVRTPRRRPEVMLRGEASALVRPYTLSPEEFRTWRTRRAGAGAR
ncbi:hypothetical protein [Streptomyces sp. MST-110588]|uniref:hypothetical protein n=1 Tax=Streptomyces sp. MST-110588 TaxID=2833628 RepID=UPI001F5DE61D|nr:hypothetical protein [Streptomyces sp. MST-110588]UNO44437.1 hypothetical protein KGS77_27060 [Streptomyces sp. MST-110588]